MPVTEDARAEQGMTRAQKRKAPSFRAISRGIRESPVSVSHARRQRNRLCELCNS